MRIGLICRPAWRLDSAHAPSVRDLDFNPNRQYVLLTGGDDGKLRFWDSRHPNLPLKSLSEHSHWYPNTPHPISAYQSNPRVQSLTFGSEYAVSERLFSGLPTLVLFDRVWSVRYNPIHDQLLLSSSSDCRLLLHCQASLSSELPGLGLDESGEEVRRNDSGQEQGKGCLQTEPVKPLEDGVVRRVEEHEESVYASAWSEADPWAYASLSYDGRLIVNRSGVFLVLSSF